MEEKNYTGVIPEQLEGSIANAMSTAEPGDVSEAVKLYEIAKERLLDVNGWQKLAGDELAHFSLCDENGNETDQRVEEGFYFKIDIPGPGTKTGDGFDWVKIERIAMFHAPNVDSIAIRVRPAPNPLKNEEKIAHFYSVDTTSTFTLTRENAKVTAAVYDRNTQINTEKLDLMDQARNVLTGLAGKLVMSKLQWKSLTDGLLEHHSKGF